MRKTLAHLGLVVLTLAGAALAQENYANWAFYHFVSVNTASGGANVAVTQTNFPLLVRLNSSNFTFAHAKGNGSDVRFTDVTGAVRYKHQVESWDSTGQAASVWVLVPSVVGNATTTLRVYSSNSLAADSSSGKAVFDTANNFQGVFHLSEATNDTARDATARNFKGVPKNRGGVNPTDTIGAIGHAKIFLGDTVVKNGGSYQILTSAGANTFTNNALNFQNDSSTAGGNGKSRFTISAWIYVKEFPTTTTNLQGIVTKSTGPTSTTQYAMKLINPAINQVTTPVGDTMRIQYNDPISAIYKSGSNNLATGGWYHVAVVRSADPGDTTGLRIWVNGFMGSTTLNTISQTTRQDLNVYIGSFSNDSGYFSGKIDEVEFSSTARDSNWIRLSYQTQKPATAAVSLGAEIANPPPPGVVTYTTNPLNLVAGTAIVADSAHSTNATSFAIAPALPSGLIFNTTNGSISGTPTANTAVATATYTVTASGNGGTTNSGTIVITVLAPPNITNQPIATSLRLNPPPPAIGGGGIAKFGIKATGSPTLTYKWVRTRVAATDTLTTGGLFTMNTAGDTLTITNPPVLDSGTTYKCVVRNSAGTAVSSAGVLVVGSVVGIWKPQMIHVTGMSPFSFRIPATGEVSTIHMTVENMGGRVVWSKDLKANASGIVSWNGAGSDGRPVASGMYVVKMKMLNIDNKTVGESTQTGINGR